MVNFLELLCVPGVYLGSAFSPFFCFLPYRRINKLRAFIAASKAKKEIPDED
jgi:hypothetical protein